MDCDTNRCSGCKARKAISEFAPSQRTVYGAWCRACRRAHYRRNNPLPEGFGKCAFCSGDFLAEAQDARRQFCSDNCKERSRYWAKNPRVQRSCLKCGKDITHMRKDATSCSEKCAQAVRVTPDKRRRQRLRQNYGITPERYDQMLADQSGCCAICGSDQPNAQFDIWHIDHDHETGNVRGLLCGPCNTGLGHFKDNVDALRRAIEYLTR